MFKNPKFLKIAKLYHKIINNFKVEKVYMEKIVVNIPTLLKIEGIAR